MAWRFNRLEAGSGCSARSRHEAYMANGARPADGAHMPEIPMHRVNGLDRSICADTPTAQLVFRAIFAPCRDHDSLPAHSRARSTSSYISYAVLDMTCVPVPSLWISPYLLQALQRQAR
ncbi:hypothetical protein DFH09DRAFT_1368820 [Mycena vulgaris]|nr:hypothetical protein DFH09DRAFT_1368820 [Mycena vulgaris]